MSKKSYDKSYDFVPAQTFNLETRWTDRIQRSKDVRRFHAAHDMLTCGASHDPVEVDHHTTAEAKRWLEIIGTTGAAMSCAFMSSDWMLPLMTFLSGGMEHGLRVHLVHVAIDIAGGSHNEAIAGLYAAVYTLLDQDVPRGFVPPEFRDLTSKPVASSPWPPRADAAPDSPYSYGGPIC